jgi:hypothetical protein
MWSHDHAGIVQTHGGKSTDFGARPKIVNRPNDIDVVVFLSGGLGKQKTSAHESFHFVLPAWPFGPQHAAAHHHSGISTIEHWPGACYVDTDNMKKTDLPP